MLATDLVSGIEYQTSRSVIEFGAESFMMFALHG